MYKRRDYQLLHANDKDDASSSSSGSDADVRDSDEEKVWSDSDNEGESPGSEDSEEDAEDPLSGLAKKVRRVDSPGVDRDDDDSDQNVEENSSDEDDLDERRESGKGAGPLNPWAEAVEDTDRSRNELDDEELVIQLGKVFKCRLCPKVLCLNETAMVSHLKSKAMSSFGGGLVIKHARYLKQLAGGTARLLIDSDGEDLTEEAETHAERHARMVEAAAMKVASTEAAEKDNPSEKKRRKSSGRQRQRKRLKVKEHEKPANGESKAEGGAKETPKKADKGRVSKVEGKKPNRKERRRNIPSKVPNATDT